MKLHIQNVKKTYDDKEVLKGGSAVFEQGKIYGLLGRNGSVKRRCLTAFLTRYPVRVMF